MHYYAQYGYYRGCTWSSECPESLPCAGIKLGMPTKVHCITYWILCLQAGNKYLEIINNLPYNCGKTGVGNEGCIDLIHTFYINVKY